MARPAHPFADSRDWLLCWYQYEGSAFFGSNEDNTPIVENVTVGPFDHIVLEQGEIESSSNNEVKCTVKAKGSSGTPILTVIAEGTLVKKGDHLCQLDSSAFEDELAAQRITVGNNEALVISSEAAVKQAEISRQEYLDGTYLTERKAILSEIALAQQALRTAELSLSSAERLAAKGTLKSLQIEAEQFAVANARNALDAGQGRLKVLDELTKAKMLVQFDSTIETARAKLNSDRACLRRRRVNWWRFNRRLMLAMFERRQMVKLFMPTSLAVGAAVLNLSSNKVPCYESSRRSFFCLTPQDAGQGANQ